MLPLLLAGGFMQMMEQQRAERQARQQARASILQSSAASLGAPTANVAGARAQMDLGNREREGRGAMLSNLMKVYGATQGGAGPAAGAPGAARPFAGSALGGAPAAPWDARPGYRDGGDVYGTTDAEIGLDNGAEDEEELRRRTGGYLSEIGF